METTVLSDCSQIMSVAEGEGGEGGMLTRDDKEGRGGGGGKANADN